MLFREGQREVAAHQEKNANGRHLGELLGGVEDAASAEREEGEHQAASDQEAGATHEGGRNLFDGDGDAEVGRSPEEINQTEGENHPPPMLALRFCHGVPELIGRSRMLGRCRKYRTARSSRAG